MFVQVSIASALQLESTAPVPLEYSWRPFVVTSGSPVSTSSRLVVWCPEVDHPSNARESNSYQLNSIDQSAIPTMKTNTIITSRNARKLACLFEAKFVRKVMGSRSKDTVSRCIKQFNVQNQVLFSSKGEVLLIDITPGPRHGIQTCCQRNAVAHGHSLPIAFVEMPVWSHQQDSWKKSQGHLDHLVYLHSLLIVYKVGI